MEIWQAYFNKFVEMTYESTRVIVTFTNKQKTTITYVKKSWK